MNSHLKFLLFCGFILSFALGEPTDTKGTSSADNESAELDPALVELSKNKTTSNSKNGAKALPSAGNGPKTITGGNNEKPGNTTGGNNEKPGNTTGGNNEKPGNTTGGNNEKPGNTTGGNNEKPGNTTGGNNEKPGNTTGGNNEKPGNTTGGNNEKPGNTTGGNNEKPWEHHGRQQRENPGTPRGATTRTRETTGGQQRETRNTPRNPGTPRECNNEKPGNTTGGNNEKTDSRNRTVGNNEKPGNTTGGNNEKPGNTTGGNNEKPGNTTGGNNEKPGNTTGGNTNTDPKPSNANIKGDNNNTHSSTTASTNESSSTESSNDVVPTSPTVVDPLVLQLEEVVKKKAGQIKHCHFTFGPLTLKNPVDIETPQIRWEVTHDVAVEDMPPGEMTIDYRISTPAAAAIQKDFSIFYMDNTTTLPKDIFLSLPEYLLPANDPGASEEDLVTLFKTIFKGSTFATTALLNGPEQTERSMPFLKRELRLMNHRFCLFRLMADLRDEVGQPLEFMPGFIAYNEGVGKNMLALYKDLEDQTLIDAIIEGEHLQDKVNKVSSAALHGNLLGSDGKTALYFVVGAWEKSLPECEDDLPAHVRIKNGNAQERAPPTCRPKWLSRVSDILAATTPENIAEPTPETEQTEEPTDHTEEPPSNDETSTTNSSNDQTSTMNSWNGETSTMNSSNDQTSTMNSWNDQTSTMNSWNGTSTNSSSTKSPNP
uniref:Uncharacterized protein n=1 Tax=Globodera rostochiensis TaxID=31243 RepID=A0A914I0D9_GLORO